MGQKTAGDVLRSGKNREEKMRLLKTKQTKKLTKKLNRMGKKGAIKKHVTDKLRSIKATKSQDSRKRVHNIIDDYDIDRNLQYSEEQEDIIPMDMLNADIDWEKSAFASMRKRKLEREAAQDAMEEADVLESQKRHFEGTLEEDREELLPIKLKDGTLVRPTQKKKKTAAQIAEEAEEEGKLFGEGDEEREKDPLEGLSAAEIVMKRRELLEEQKRLIAGYSMALVSDPQTNIFKLRELLNLCSGGSAAHPIIRETVQKLAIASTVQVLVDIIPGYSIRPLTDAEKEQSVAKDTKKLQTFEDALLRYYLKFLQLCEKLFKKLKPALGAETHTNKMGMVALRAVCRMVVAAPHFNYATNIVTAVTKMVMNGHEEKVANEDKKSGKGLLIGKKLRLKKERGMKSRRKYEKQLERLSNDMKELDAAENLSTKLKTATEAMKQVFHIYFSILRRMPTVALLQPVLEGLSKFAHLLNVEFFSDMIKCMEELIDNQDLSILDTLNCVNTVFVILSGDGQALNVDPFRFYKSVYELLPALPFQKDHAVRRKLCALMARCLDKMINARRKQVPLSRVAGFARRIMLTCVVLDDICALPLMAVTRTFFVSHPKLLILVETAEEEEGGGSVMYNANHGDPDSANALRSDATLELSRLAKRRHRLLSSIGRNILNGVPSTGMHRVDPDAVSLPPWKLSEAEESHEEAGAFTLLMQQAKKRNVKLTSKTLYSSIITLLETDH
uniref:NOC3-like protein n=1 Tax=Pristionchus pacificus TaxID=54126 RepID=A0A2A6C9C8_PRIPA|eukprot:PDM74621.1 hypothetical protein PRIPAC_41977 [Pristionchus pacificus]